MRSDISKIKSDVQDVRRKLYVMKLKPGLIVLIMNKKC